MQLEKNTKGHLKDLVLKNYTKEINESYLHDMVAIFNQDPLFNRRLRILSDDQTKIMATEYENLKIKYNMEGFLNYFPRFYKNQLNHNPLLSDIDFSLFLNYWFSFSLLHEISHTYQFMCNDENISTYLEVNSLYKEIFASLKRTRNFHKWIYKFKHNCYSFERNADLTTAEILAAIFEDTDLEYYAQLLHLNYALMPGYKMKNGHVISPVAQTMKYLPIKEMIDYANLPFAVAFSHGFQISGKDYHFIYDEVLEARKNGEALDYDEVMKRIRSLEKNRKYEGDQY